jgi:hypothetical protein
MECYYHPSRESTDNCAICGKSICKECGLEIAGKVYCKECLEKIVGLNLAASQPEPEPKPEPEPVRLEKKESPEAQIEMANLTMEPSQGIEMEELTKESPNKVADDSPYNIKDSIQYEGGVESSYDENYQPKVSLNQAMEANQKVIPEQPVEDVREEYIPEQPVENVREEYVPEQPVQDVREEYIQQEPANQAVNEYDTLAKPQAPPSNDYIYPDHYYEPEETSARQAVEDKYERYLDDLYFDEAEVPLNEQLARDEEKFGSLTRNEYKPRNTREQKFEEEDDLDRRIREELARREEEKHHPKKEKIHNIEYEDEKEPIGVVDIILTIILVIVILIVLFYLIYLFKLSTTYPTFIDAVYGLKNPGALIGALLG